jgi:hypothetical protein
MDYASMTTDEIGGIFSDWYKDTHGFRPRHVSFDDREALINGCMELAAYHDKMNETFEGREELRENGWIVHEVDPELQRRAYWLAQERDRIKKEQYAEHWHDSLAEARHYAPKEAA